MLQYQPASLSGLEEQRFISSGTACTSHSTRGSPPWHLHSRSQAGSCSSFWNVGGCGVRGRGSRDSKHTSIPDITCHICLKHFGQNWPHLTSRRGNTQSLPCARRKNKALVCGIGRYLTIHSSPLLNSCCTPLYHI